MHEALLSLCHDAVRRSLALGADEVSAQASHGTNSNIRRREGRVEQASEATSHGLSVSMTVDGRWSSHSTSDLRSDALDDFLERAVDATRFLEEDPDRALPEPALCGRGASERALDQLDPSLAHRAATQRSVEAQALEQAVDALDTPSRISATTYVSDGSSTTARVMSNGFADVTRGGWFVRGAELSLEEPDGKRPEAYAHYAARHHADLPSVEAIAMEAERRALAQRGMGPIATTTCPMVLAARAAGRILGLLAAPLSGGAIQQGRSCLAGKRGEAIGSSLLTLIDDPTLPRGLASRPWDGDALVARKRPIIEAGALRTYYLSVYYARKLGEPPTTGGRSNWVVPPGQAPWQSAVRHAPQAVLVESFLGGNANPVTGDFSFGIRGHLVENGEISRPIAEMNVAGNILDLFHRLVAVGDDPWLYSAVRSPTLVFDGVAFSGT